ncbi:MAG: phosphotransferase [Candidatus Nealsonbacteria bacterium]
MGYDFLKTYLRDNYPILGKIKKVELLEHNNINSTNYFVFAGKGKYVLRNFTDGSSPEKMEKTCKILKFCIERKIKVSEPILRKKGNFVDEKKNFYLTKYYPGGFFQGRESELKDVAKNLALLHLVLAKSPIRYNYKLGDEYYKHLTLAELRQIKKKALAGNTKFDKTVLENFDYFTESFSRKKKVDSKENQLIHYDFHPGNVIFKNNKVAVILDFNAMRRGERIKDLAFASFKFSFYETKNIELMKKRLKLIVDTYLKYNPIEINNLNYYFSYIVLERLSYILKKRYFENSNSWSIDLEKQINLLKLCSKMNYQNSK